MRNYTPAFNSTQISSSVNQALFASKGAPVRAERESPDAASTQEAPLGTNTVLLRETSVTSLLARLSNDISDMQYQRDLRELRFILQDVAKRVYEARTPPVYVKAFLKPTHYQAKNKYGRLTYKLSPSRPSLKQKPTHYEVQAPWGLVYVKRDQKPEYLWCEEQGCFRRRFGYENATHVRLNHPYFRLGACMQLAASARLSSAGGDPMSRDDWQRAGEEFKEVSIWTRTCEKTGQRKAGFKGYCKCASNVLCTECMPALLEGRSQEIDKGIYQHVKNGGYVIFVTWTVRHKLNHKLADVLQVLKDGREFARTSKYKPWRDFAEEIGHEGFIRSFEWRWTTANGHHPHIHELMFLNKKPDPVKIKQFLYKRFAKRIQDKYGSDFVPSFERGIRVDVCMTSSQFENCVQLQDGSIDLNSAEQLASYMSKTLDVDKSIEEYLKADRWSMGDEMAKGNAKRSQKNGYDGISYSYISMLIHWQHCNDMLQRPLTDAQRRDFVFAQKVCKDVLHEYAEWLKGIAVIYWSPGLKDRLNIAELDDEQLLEEAESRLTDYVCSFSVDQLRIINTHKLKSKALRLSEDLPPDKAKLAIYALIDACRDRPRFITEYG